MKKNFRTNLDADDVGTVIVTLIVVSSLVGPMIEDLFMWPDTDHLTAMSLNCVDHKKKVIAY